MTHVRRRIFRNSLAVENTFLIKLNGIDEGTDLCSILDKFEAVFDDFLDKIIESFGRKDVKMVLMIQHPELQNNIILPLSHINSFSGQYLINAISAVCQSKSSLRYTSQFIIKAGIIKYSRMHLAGLSSDIIDFSKTNNSCLLKKNKSIYFTPIHSDNQCIIRSIAYALKFKERGNKWVRAVYKSSNILEREAKKLALKYDIMWNKDYFFSDIPFFEDKIEIMISLLSIVQGRKSYVYFGNEKYKKNRIFLFLTEPQKDTNTLHVCVIKRIETFLGHTLTTCETCHNVVKKSGNHTCSNSIKSTFCFNCESTKCKDFEGNPFISCLRCQKTFNSIQCFEYHKKCEGKKKKSTCSKKFVCHFCQTSQTDYGGNSPENHKHFTFLCKGCGLWQPMGHLCYVRIPKIPESLTNNIICLDFECIVSHRQFCSKPDFKGAQRFDGSLGCSFCQDQICNIFEHIPVFLALTITCDKCISIPFRNTDITFCDFCGIRCSNCNKCNRHGDYTDPPCIDFSDSDSNKCGSRTITFSGLDCVDKTIRFLTSSKRKGYTIFGYAAGGYDYIFILQKFASIYSQYHPQKIIYNNGRIISFRLDRIGQTYLDAYKYFNMSLAKVAKAFLSKEDHDLSGKQFFPYLFLNKNNMNAIYDAYPSKYYFDYENMSAQRKQEFDEWYQSVQNSEFDVKKVLKSYCISDCHLLVSVLIKFRDMICYITKSKMAPVGIDTFKLPTLGAVALNIFKSLHLKEFFKITLCKSDNENDTIDVEGIKRGQLMILNLPNGIQVEQNELHQHDYKIKEAKFEKSQIGLVPTHLYKGRRNNYSQVSIRFLKFMELVLKKKFADSHPDLQIQHALQHGERQHYLHKLQVRIYFDGYLELEQGSTIKRMAFAFHGCR